MPFIKIAAPCGVVLNVILSFVPVNNVAQLEKKKSGTILNNINFFVIFKIQLNFLLKFSIKNLFHINSL